MKVTYKFGMPSNLWSQLRLLHLTFGNGCLATGWRLEPNTKVKALPPTLKTYYARVEE